MRRDPHPLWRFIADVRALRVAQQLLKGVKTWIALDPAVRLWLISRDVMIVGTHDERKAMPDVREHLLLVILPVADLSEFQNIDVRLRKVCLELHLKLRRVPDVLNRIGFLPA